MDKVKEVLLYIVNWLTWTVIAFAFMAYGDILPQPWFGIGLILAVLGGFIFISGLTLVVVYPIYKIIEFLYEWIRDRYTNYQLMSASEFLELRSYEHLSDSELLGMKNKYPYNKKIATVVEETLHLRYKKMLYGSFMKDTESKETKPVKLYKSATNEHVYYTWFNKREEMGYIMAESSVKDSTKPWIERNSQTDDKK